MITEKQRKLIKDIEDAAINTMPVFAKLDYIEPMSAALESEFARLNGEVERQREALAGILLLADDMTGNNNERLARIAKRCRDELFGDVK